MVSALEEIWGKQEQPEPADYWTFMKTAFDQTIAENHVHPTGVFNRTLLDHLARCLLDCNEYMSSNTCRAMLALTKVNLDKYDAVFYLPTPETASAPETALGLMTKALLDHLEIEYLTVTPPDEDHKLDRAVKQIRSWNGGRSVG